jgi:hypothetical protein
MQEPVVVFFTTMLFEFIHRDALGVPVDTAGIWMFPNVSTSIASVVPPVSHIPPPDMIVSAFAP